MKLSNCGINDDGAMYLFKELRNLKSVNMVDLNHNSLTDKCFDGLVTLLQNNLKIKVQIKGLNMKNKLSLNKIKNYKHRIWLS